MNRRLDDIIPQELVGCENFIEECIKTDRRGKNKLITKCIEYLQRDIREYYYASLCYLYKHDISLFNSGEIVKCIVMTITQNWGSRTKFGMKKKLKYLLDLLSRILASVVVDLEFVLPVDQAIRILRYHLKNFLNGKVDLLEHFSEVFLVKIFRCCGKEIDRLYDYLLQKDFLEKYYVRANELVQLYRKLEDGSSANFLHHLVINHLDTILCSHSEEVCVGVLTILHSMAPNPSEDQNLIKHLITMKAKEGHYFQNIASWLGRAESLSYLSIQHLICLEIAEINAANMNNESKALFSPNSPHLKKITILMAVSPTQESLLSHVLQDFCCGIPVQLSYQQICYFVNYMFHFAISLKRSGNSGAFKLRDYALNLFRRTEGYEAGTELYLHMCRFFSVSVFIWVSKVDLEYQQKNMSVPMNVELMKRVEILGIQNDILSHLVSTFSGVSEFPTMIKLVLFLDGSLTSDLDPVLLHTYRRWFERHTLLNEDLIVKLQGQVSSELLKKEYFLDVFEELLVKAGTLFAKWEGQTETTFFPAEQGLALITVLQTLSETSVKHVHIRQLHNRINICLVLFLSVCSNIFSTDVWKKNVNPAVGYIMEALLTNQCTPSFFQNKKRFHALTSPLPNSSKVRIRAFCQRMWANSQQTEAFFSPDSEARGLWYEFFVDDNPEGGVLPALQKRDVEKLMTWNEKLGLGKYLRMCEKPNYLDQYVKRLRQVKPKAGILDQINLMKYWIDPLIRSEPDVMMRQLDWELVLGFFFHYYSNRTEKNKNKKKKILSKEQRKNRRLVKIVEGGPGIVYAELVVSASMSCLSPSLRLKKQKLDFFEALVNSFMSQLRMHAISYRGVWSLLFRGLFGRTRDFKSCSRIVCWLLGEKSNFEISRSEGNMMMTDEEEEEVEGEVSDGEGQGMGRDGPGHDSFASASREEVRDRVGCIYEVIGKIGDVRVRYNVLQLLCSYSPSYVVGECVKAAARMNLLVDETMLVLSKNFQTIGIETIRIPEFRKMAEMYLEMVRAGKGSTGLGRAGQNVSILSSGPLTIRKDVFHCLMTFYGSQFKSIASHSPDLRQYLEDMLKRNFGMFLKEYRNILDQLIESGCDMIFAELPNLRAFPTMREVRDGTRRFLCRFPVLSRSHAKILFREIIGRHVNSNSNSSTSLGQELKMFVRNELSTSEKRFLLHFTKIYDIAPPFEFLPRPKVVNEGVDEMKKSEEERDAREKNNRLMMMKFKKFMNRGSIHNLKDKVGISKRPQNGGDQSKGKMRLDEVMKNDPSLSSLFMIDSNTFRRRLIISLFFSSSSQSTSKSKTRPPNRPPSTYTVYLFPLFYHRTPKSKIFELFYTTLMKDIIFPGPVPALTPFALQFIRLVVSECIKSSPPHNSLTTDFPMIRKPADIILGTLTKSMEALISHVAKTEKYLFSKSGKKSGQKSCPALHDYWKWGVEFVSGELRRPLLRREFVRKYREARARDGLLLDAPRLCQRLFFLYPSEFCFFRDSYLGMKNAVEQKNPKSDGFSMGTTFEEKIEMFDLKSDKEMLVSAYDSFLLHCLKILSLPLNAQEMVEYTSRNKGLYSEEFLRDQIEKRRFYYFMMKEKVLLYPQMMLGYLDNIIRNMLSSSGHMNLLDHIDGSLSSSLDSVLIRIGQCFDTLRCFCGVVGQGFGVGEFCKIVESVSHVIVSTYHYTPRMQPIWNKFVALLGNMMVSCVSEDCKHVIREWVDERYGRVLRRAKMVYPKTKGLKKLFDVYGWKDEIWLEDMNAGDEWDGGWTNDNEMLNAKKRGVEVGSSGVPVLVLDGEKVQSEIPVDSEMNKRLDSMNLTFLYSDKVNPIQKKMNNERIYSFLEGIVESKEKILQNIKFLLSLLEVPGNRHVRKYSFVLLKNVLERNLEDPKLYKQIIPKFIDVLKHKDKGISGDALSFVFEFAPFMNEYMGELLVVLFTMEESLAQNQMKKILRFIFC